MIEKRGYDAPGSPFTILKRVEGERNKGFELSGETYDDIFPVNQPEHPPEEKAMPIKKPPNKAPGCGKVKTISRPVTADIIVCPFRSIVPPLVKKPLLPWQDKHIFPRPRVQINPPPQNRVPAVLCFTKIA